MKLFFPVFAALLSLQSVASAGTIREADIRGPEVWLEFMGGNVRKDGLRADLEAIKAYGVWQEKKLYGKVSFGVVRTTFIINEEGKIEKILPKVNPDKNAAEVLAML